MNDFNQTEDKREISSFRGDYFFLSNMYPCNFKYNGMTWRSAEHAYQAQKATNKIDMFAIKSAGTPQLSKKIGRMHPCRPDWEDVKVDIMRAVVKAKFSDPELAAKLLATEGFELIEGNDWQDRVWGCVRDEDGDWAGKNWLGVILMEEREFLVANKISEKSEKTESKSEIEHLGIERQKAHPQGTKRYYTDPNKEDIIGVAGEKAFADRYGFKIDDSIRPEGDGHVDFRVEIFENGKKVNKTIDVKTAQKAYHLLIKVWEIKVCADILILVQYNSAEDIKLLGWATKEEMQITKQKTFSNLNILNHFKHRSELRPMADLDKLLTGAIQIN